MFVAICCIVTIFDPCKILMVLHVCASDNTPAAAAAIAAYLQSTILILLG